MRVITGTARGTRLRTVKGGGTRPTSDRVKEALFSILASRVVGARFLDLFSGTGAIAIEALSRGAQTAVLVEKNRRALASIRENLRLTKVEDKATVMGIDVDKALRILGKEAAVFDIIFMDPPYQLDCVPDLVGLIHSEGLLCPDGLVVCEQESGTGLPQAIGDLTLTRTQTYGDTELYFYQYQ